MHLMLRSSRFNHQNGVPVASAVYKFKYYSPLLKEGKSIEFAHLFHGAVHSDFLIRYLLLSRARRNLQTMLQCLGASDDLR